MEEFSLPTEQAAGILCSSIGRDKTSQQRISVALICVEYLVAKSLELVLLLLFVLFASKAPSYLLQAQAVTVAIPITDLSNSHPKQLPKATELVLGNTEQMCLHGRAVAESIIRGGCIQSQVTPLSLDPFRNRRLLCVKERVPKREQFVLSLRQKNSLRLATRKLPS